jgi:hypothetical protein
MRISLDVIADNFCFGEQRQDVSQQHLSPKLNICDVVWQKVIS